MQKADKLRASNNDAQLESLQQEHYLTDLKIKELQARKNPNDDIEISRLKFKRLRLKRQIEALGGTTLTNGRRKPPKGVRPRLVPVGYRPGA